MARYSVLQLSYTTPSSASNEIMSISPDFSAPSIKGSRQDAKIAKDKHLGFRSSWRSLRLGESKLRLRPSAARPRWVLSVFRRQHDRRASHGWLVPPGWWPGSRITGHGPPLHAIGPKRKTSLTRPPRACPPRSIRIEDNPLAPPTPCTCSSFETGMNADERPFECLPGELLGELS